LLVLCGLAALAGYGTVVLRLVRDRRRHGAVALSKG